MHCLLISLTTIWILTFRRPPHRQEEDNLHPQNFALQFSNSVGPIGPVYRSPSRLLKFYNQNSIRLM